MRKHLFLLVLVLLLVLGLTACGGGDSAPASSAGEAAGAGDAAGATCHSLEPGVTMVGPSLAGIGSAAGSRVSGVSAEDYLLKSIMDPNADIAEGFAAGIMPAALAGKLTEQQTNDLVAFLLSLK